MQEPVSWDLCEILGELATTPPLSCPLVSNITESLQWWLKTNGLF